MAIVTTERKITATASDGKKMTVGEISLFLASLEAAGVGLALVPVVRTRGLGGIKSITVTVRDDAGGSSPGRVATPPARSPDS